MNLLSTLLLFESISGGELILVLLAVFLLFGPNKIPEIARGLAKGIRDIKNATNDIQQEVNKTIDPIKKELQGSVDKLKKELDKEVTDIKTEKKNTSSEQKTDGTANDIAG
jgi:sec-independent protein translocase protein TatA